MKMRGMYGQSEGNEKRIATSATSDHYADNALVEGKKVTLINNLLKQRRYEAVASVMEEMRKEGWSQKRIESVYARATYGTRV